MGSASQPSVLELVDTPMYLPRKASSFWDPDGIHFAPSGSQELGSCLATLVMSLLERRKLQLARQQHASSSFRPQQVLASSFAVPVVAAASQPRLLRSPSPLRAPIVTSMHSAMAVARPPNMFAWTPCMQPPRLIVPVFVA